jgi:hypothetical protein
MRLEKRGGLFPPIVSLGLGDGQWRINLLLRDANVRTRGGCKGLSSTGNNKQSNFSGVDGVWNK